MLRILALPFRALIRRLYYRYVFREDEWIQHYVMQFTPSDLRGMNPVFLIAQIDALAKKLYLRAEVRVNNPGPDARYDVQLIGPPR
jgi:hypothetical protein